MRIFPETTFSKTEMEVIAANMTHPSVKKYLQHLAYTAGQDIATGEPAEGESAESYLRREFRVKGQLDALQALLSISLPS